MSVIAHWIEQQGIHTVVIGLVKLHLEKVQPPRALWVPFELGRPMGAPTDAAFQSDVLTTALSMIEAQTTRPTIIDYPYEDPRATADPTWNSPQFDNHFASVEAEVNALKPLYQQFCVSSSRTTVGVAKIPIGQSALLVDSLTGELPPETARPDISALLMVRLAFDDLKAYYLESALANSKSHGKPNSEQLHHWFWQETYLGKRIRTLQAQWLQSDHRKLAALAERSLVPRRWRDN